MRRRRNEGENISLTRSERVAITVQGHNLSTLNEVQGVNCDYMVPFPYIFRSLCC